VTLGDGDFRKSPMKIIYRKVIKNSVTTCHLSPALKIRQIEMKTNGRTRRHYENFRMCLNRNSIALYREHLAFGNKLY
jgi:hypothetical protein